MSRLGLATALALPAHDREGLRNLAQEIEAWRASGTGLMLPQWLALYAEAANQQGHTEEALQALTEALAYVEASEERCYASELHRLRGTILLQTGSPEAEVCFHQALAIAREQQAKWWELRATVSLARLWQQQGKRAEARQLLEAIYGWFTEGFDTVDLQEARALLDALA